MLTTQTFVTECATLLGETLVQAGMTAIEPWAIGVGGPKPFHNVEHLAHYIAPQDSATGLEAAQHLLSEIKAREDGKTIEFAELPIQRDNPDYAVGWVGYVICRGSQFKDASGQDVIRVDIAFNVD